MVEKLERNQKFRNGIANFIRQHWFKFAQRLSQALLVPIAVLPAAGVMIGLAYSPIQFLPPQANELLLTLGQLIFDIMPILFAIAIAIGFCRDQGIAAFSAVFGYGIFSSTLTVLTDATPIAIQILWGVDTIDTGIAGGLLVGAATCLAVSLSQYVRLPVIFSFFEGRRSTPILMLPLGMAVAYALSLIWPALSIWIEHFSNWVVYQKPALAFTLYGAVERLLIPLGLHHIWNAPFFLEVGQYYDNGELVRGEIARYLAGDPTAGNLAGGYLIKMWGLPAAAIAIWHCADRSEKNRVAGIMISAAAASWLTGVTEPIEFAFMFVAPILFLVHACLSGLAYGLCVVLDIHHSIVFSQGLVDFSLLLHMSQNTVWLLVLGPLTAAIYYFIFRVSILTFNLKTPGRIEPDPIEQKESVLSIINALGGAKNIVSLNACLTRIRVSVETPTLVDRKRLTRLGAKGVIIAGQGVQVIYGTKAETVRNLLQQHIDDSP